MLIRKADTQDLTGVLSLYDHLHGEGRAMDEDHTINDNTLDIWQKIIRTDNINLLVGDEDGKPVSSCILVIVPNLTHGQRPYALIENVVTHKDYRQQGYAMALLEQAKQIAQQNNCYKIMLMTGAKDQATLDFYRRAGYNSEDKTAFIQWL